jgi:hypothetical protein
VSGRSREGHGCGAAPLARDFNPRVTFIVAHQAKALPCGGRPRAWASRFESGRGTTRRATVKSGPTRKVIIELRLRELSVLEWLSE